jgi:hypothetical protein
MSNEDKTEETNTATEEGAGEQNKNSERDSGADDYKVDERNRGERPDNLRRRSEWFEKRTGGR